MKQKGARSLLNTNWEVLRTWKRGDVTFALFVDPQVGLTTYLIEAFREIEGEIVPMLIDTAEEARLYLDAIDEIHRWIDSQH